MSTATKGRIEAAIVEVVVEQRFEAATSAEVCRRAGVSQAEFHQNFADLEDGVYAVFLRFREEVQDRTLAAFGRGSGWRDQLRCVYWAMLDYFEEDRVRARFLAVEALRSSERASVAFDEFSELMVELVDQGRYEMPDPDRLTRATAQAVTGGAAQQIQAAVAEDMPDGSQIGRELMFNVVAPYLGVETALEELAYERPSVMA